MVFSLIFLLVLAIIAITGSYLLFKSNLDFSEQFYSILMIFLIFSSVTILNEYKQPLDLASFISNNMNNSIVSNNISHFLWEILHEEEFNSLEKRFYMPFHNMFKNTYKLPIMKDSKAFIMESLGFSEEKFRGKEEFFIFMDIEKNMGISFALRELSRLLQSEMKEFPILYVNLKKMHSFLLGDINYPLRISSPEVLYKVLENFNKKGLIPMIIIDGIEKSYIEKGKKQKNVKLLNIKSFDFQSYKEKIEKKSMIFDRLKEIFHRFQIKILVLNYEKTGKFNKLPHFIERRRIRSQDRNWESYIREVLNDFIGDKEKKLKAEDIFKWRESLELDFRVISEYYKNLKSFKSPEGLSY